MTLDAEVTWTYDASHYPEPLSPLSAGVWFWALGIGIREAAHELRARVVRERRVGVDVVRPGGRERHGRSSSPWASGPAAGAPAAPGSAVSPSARRRSASAGTTTSTATPAAARNIQGVGTCLTTPRST